MKNHITLLILLFILPTLTIGQNTQIIKGKSAIKRIKYNNANAIKIKKITSDIKLDSITFNDINSNHVLDCEEDAFLYCYISNTSNDTLKNVIVALEKISNNILFPANNTIEKISPNSILELSIPIKNSCAEKQPDSPVQLSLDLSVNEILVSESNFNIAVGQKGTPKLETLYNYSIKKDTIINALKEPVSFVHLNLDIKNIGNSPIFKVSGILELIYLGGYIISNKETYDYEYINPGDKKEINIDLVIDADYSQEIFPVIFKLKGNGDELKYSNKIEIEL